MKEIVAGCVILYKPEKSVLANIETYINSIDKLIVINNSPEIDSSIKQSLLKLPKVEFINNPENLGVAKALNQAASIAILKGYAWMLTMDQDSSINDNSFFQIAYKLLLDKKVGIIAASFLPQDKARRGLKEDFQKTPLVITSGNLLNLNAWKVVGGFNEKYFIDEVDHEFCLKLFERKFSVLESRSVFLNHELGEKFEVYDNLLRRKVILSWHPPLRIYYITRNNFDLWKRFFYKTPLVIFRRIKLLGILYLQIIRYYPHKRNYFKMMLKGFYHFLSSQYGAYRY